MELWKLISQWVDDNRHLLPEHAKNLTVDSVWTDGCGRIQYNSWFIAFIYEDHVVVMPRHKELVKISAADPAFFTRLLIVLEERIQELNSIDG